MSTGLVVLNYCQQANALTDMLTVTKAIGNCLWVRMDDDGTEWGGGKPYWKVLPAAQRNTGPTKAAPAIRSS